MAAPQPPAGHAWFGAYPGAGNAAPNAGYEGATMANRVLATYLRYYAFSSGTFPTAADETLMAGPGGRIGYFSLQNQFGTTYTIKWANVAAGTYDTNLTNIANAILAGGNPCFIGYENEPDDGGKIGSGGSNLGLATDYIAAYQHVATKLRSIAGSLVIMTYVPYGPTASAAACYPGDSYCDWIGFDPYDATLSHGTPLATYTPIITWLNGDPYAVGGGAGSGGAHGKPIGIFETGVANSQPAASVATWINRVPADLASLSTTWGSTFKAWLWFNSGGTLGNMTITPGTAPATALATIGASSFFSPAAVSISTSSLPGATSGVAYSQAVTAINGTTPYAWAISAGALPAGLSLNSVSGVISGTTSAIGTASFTVKVTDFLGVTATAALSITVSSSAPLSITTVSLPGAVSGAAYSQAVIAAGGTAPYTWAISAGALPTGLTIGSSTGIISGTTTALGTASFTVQVTDSLSATATAVLSITVTSPAIPQPGAIILRTQLSHVPVPDPPGILIPAPYGALVPNSGQTIFRLVNTDSLPGQVTFMPDVVLRCASGHPVGAITLFPSHVSYPVPGLGTIWLGSHDARYYGNQTQDGLTWIIPSSGLILLTAFEP